MRLFAFDTFGLVSEEAAVNVVDFVRDHPTSLHGCAIMYEHGSFSADRFRVYGYLCLPDDTDSKRLVCGFFFGENQEFIFIRISEIPIYPGSPRVIVEVCCQGFFKHGRDYIQTVRSHPLCRSFGDRSVLEEVWDPKSSFTFEELSDGWYKLFSIRSLIKHLK